ncbi:hypothetical protein B0I27_106125 [Arcticibacter pallidicorallinus]|uniref:Nucleotide-diphospho-sugar transferase n=1 Tax=Arcticibacter pallidicorallinus TaxID=1259464 RepID=A0A2T0U377_9SPHI|nr:hypothetical protein [Arcticibacter pallidicorallinus]PRY52365.1 hypothetical protein B0I27_106125 [Arcticibacter pallidicorallinus]
MFGVLRLEAFCTDALAILIKMKNIVLLCYGKEIEYNRAIVSILSFLAWNRKASTDFRIVCFTDNPAYLNKYLSDVKVEYIYLSPSRMNHMLGGTTYIHRRKICILQDVYLRYPEDDLIFLDSDTFFISHAHGFMKKLESGYAMMHEREYRIEEAPEIYRKYMSEKLENAAGYPLAFIRQIESRTFAVKNEELSFSIDQHVWNSGVLGLKNQFLPYLDSVLSLNDEFYKESKWFISEQLAFGLLLQQKTQIAESSAFVNHYHQSKHHVDPRINSLLDGEFLKMKLVEKLACVKAFTVNVNKLVILDRSSMIAIGAFKRNNIIKGFKYAWNALRSIPMHSMIYSYTKDRIAMMASNRRF